MDKIKQKIDQKTLCKQSWNADSLSMNIIRASSSYLKQNRSIYPATFSLHTEEQT